MIFECDEAEVWSVVILAGQEGRGRYGGLKSQLACWLMALVRAYSVGHLKVEVVSLILLR